MNSLETVKTIHSSSPPPHSQAHNWTMANQGLEEKKTPVFKNWRPTSRWSNSSQKDDQGPSTSTPSTHLHKLTGQSVRCNICASPHLEEQLLPIRLSNIPSLWKGQLLSPTMTTIPQLGAARKLDICKMVAKWTHQQSTDRPTWAKMPWRIVTSVVS